MVSGLFYFSLLPYGIDPLGLFPDGPSLKLFVLLLSVPRLLFLIPFSIFRSVVFSLLPLFSISPLYRRLTYLLLFSVPLLSFVLHSYSPSVLPHGGDGSRY